MQDQNIGSQVYDRTKSGKILLRYQESTFGSKTLNSKSSEIAKTGKKKGGGGVIFRSIKKKKCFQWDNK